LPFTTNAYIGICCHYIHTYARQGLKGCGCGQIAIRARLGLGPDWDLPDWDLPDWDLPDWDLPDWDLPDWDLPNCMTYQYCYVCFCSV